MTTIDWLLYSDGAVHWAIAALVQCTAATSLAVVLVAVLRRRAALRQVVLRSTVACVLCCPLVTLAARSAGVTWMDFFGAWSRALEEDDEGVESVRSFEEGAADVADVFTNGLSMDSAIDTVVAPPTLEDSAEIWESPHAESSRIPAGDHATVTSLPALLEWNRPAMFLGLAIWGAGSVVCLLGIARSAWKLSKMLRDAAATDCQTLGALVDSLRRELSLTTFPRLVCSHAAERPLSAGIMRPAIILPPGFGGRLNATEVRCVLLHELAHVLRRDHLALLADRLMLACFWFHPLVHWTKWQSERAREETCDNFVLTFVDRVSYSESLLRVARLFPSTSPLAGGIALLDKRWSLEERISGLLEERRITMTRVNLFTSAAFLFVLAISVTLLGAATWAAPQDDAKRLSSRTDAVASQASPAYSTADNGQAAPSAASFNVLPYQSQQSSGVATGSDVAEAPLTESADAFYFYKAPATRERWYQAAPTDGRVALIDLERVFAESSAFQQRIDMLKKTVETSSRKRKAGHQEIQALSEAIGAISNNDDAKAALEKLVDAKKAAVVQETRSERADAMKQERAMYYDFYKIVRDVIRAYALEQGIDVVLRHNSKKPSVGGAVGRANPATGRDVLKIINQPIVYIRHESDDRIDITDDIIRRLEEHASAATK